MRDLTNMKKKKQIKDDSGYCSVCGGCGYVDCDGVEEFLNKHVKGKTNCLNESGFISDLIQHFEEYEEENWNNE